MTDLEMLKEIRSESLLNRVRRELYAFVARAEQTMMQGRRLTPIEVRRQEFWAAERIVAMVREEDAAEAAKEER